MEIKSRPEDPALDDSQMEDLKKFLSRRDKAQLKADLDKLRAGAETDKGPYKSGGTPANVTRTHIVIQDLLSSKK